MMTCTGCVVLLCISVVLPFSKHLEQTHVHDVHCIISCLPLVAGTIKNIFVDEYHDGFRINWDRHNLADNEGISYHLQVHNSIYMYVIMLYLHVHVQCTYMTIPLIMIGARQNNNMQQKGRAM